MKIEIDTDDAFFAGGNYDRIHLVNHNKSFDDLSGHDSFWLIQVRKGTPSDERIGKILARKLDPPNVERSHGAENPKA